MSEPAGTSIAAIVARAAAGLELAGLPVAEARQDAAVLARHILGWDLERWLGHQRDDAPADFEPAFAPLVARRAAREPVAYITGAREFYWRTFTVTPTVLIPRPETELVVEAAIGASAEYRYPDIIDIGTGSGCIAATLAAEMPHATVVATDISTAALEVAAVNAERHGVAGRIEFRRGAFFAGFAGPFDMVVSNPPYVAAGDRPTMAPEVAAHEPAQALFAGADGLDCIRPLLSLSAESLRPRGALIFEFGFGQMDHIKRLIRNQPALRLQAMLPDLQGIPRVAVVRRL
jgi:release factor glutamine methyltransferase